MQYDGQEGTRQSIVKDWKNKEEDDQVTTTQRTKSGCHEDGPEDGIKVKKEPKRYK